LDPREYLFSLERFGIKLGLDNITHLLEAAGNPHEQFPCVHVAGTNGKGSVIALLDAMLRAAGYRTGRYTSPHLISLHERLLHNAHPIEDLELDEQLAHFLPIAMAMDPPPTFFEFITSAAFRWFSQRRVDLALIEVGLGGRFDSTNVIIPELSVITNIDLEHTRYLGETLSEIAFEKAGIIKQGIPVVVGETRPEPRDVILARAAYLASPVSLRGRDFESALHGGPFTHHIDYSGPRLIIERAPLGLPGTYQADNAAVAVAAAEALGERFPRLDRDAVARGLAEARWPCRLERVLDSPPVIIDVAHNEAGARQLAAQLQACILVMGVSADKDASRMIDAVAPIARDLILTQFTGPRALPVEQLCAAAGSHPHRRADRLADAIDLGIGQASSSAPLLITGSVFTAGEARALLVREYGAPPLAF